MIRFFLNPFNILWLLLGGSVLALLLKRNTLFRWLFFSAMGWFLIISTPLIPTAALGSLENRYEPYSVEDSGTDFPKKNEDYHIVVLGGGHGFDDRLPSNSLLSSQALARLNEGIRLHRQLPDSKLVLSGYSASGRTTQAEMLQETALLLGVEPEKILLQKEPATTWQEAEAYAATFGNAQRVLLVTCASHMHRAIQAFEYFGTSVIPSPTCYRILIDPYSRRSWIPSAANIERMRIALFEYSAILRDRFRMRWSNTNGRE